MVQLLAIVVVLYLGSLEARFGSSDTAIEEHYETEFDLREPKVFAAENNWELLTTRPKGFDTIESYNSDGTLKSSTHVSNWERFALNYWFETRVVNSSCPELPQGIATTCDWALMIPCMFGDPYKPPRTIFVHNYMLPHFIESTLRFMDKDYRFVLISGGTDLTIPRSTDQRYKLLRGFSQGLDGGQYFQTLVNAPQLIHWFCENHDLAHPKLSTMPTGFYANADKLYYENAPARELVKPLKQRPLQMLVSDRVRSGTGQWATRAHVKELCGSLGSALCRQPSADNMAEGIDHKQYLQIVSEVSFIVCTHGGGIDPSPKAFEAVLAGTIPIIRHSVLDDAYQRLPAVLIDSWDVLFNNPNLEQVLSEWREKLQPYYEEGSALRQKVVDRLKTAYWVEQVQHKIREYEQNQQPHLSNSSTVPRILREQSNMFRSNFFSDAKGGKHLRRRKLNAAIATSNSTYADITLNSAATASTHLLPNNLAISTRIV